MKIIFRRGTAEELDSYNPILAKNEIVRESDTGKWKIGTGARSWKNLPYQHGALPEWINFLTRGTIDPMSTDHDATEISITIDYVGGVWWASARGNKPHEHLSLFSSRDGPTQAINNMIEGAKYIASCQRDNEGFAIQKAFIERFIAAVLGTVSVEIE